MELTWVQSESKESPLAIDEKTSQTGVYLRKNIVFADEKYTYQEAYLTKDEYTAYKLSEIISDVIELKHDDAVIDSYTLQLIEEGIL